MAMKLEKIAVGIDFSEQSEVALEQAMNVARRSGAEVVLIHACSVPDAAKSVPLTMQGTVSQLETVVRERLAEDRKKLEQLRERADSGTVEVSHVVIDGFADSGVVEAAAEIAADLIVVGTHGRTGFGRFLLGSVAERTVRLSESNVMVARPQSKGAGGFHKLLVPIDLSDDSKAVLDAAIALAAKDATIEVFHAWQLPGATWATLDVSLASGGTLRSALSASAADRGAELLAPFRDETNASITFTHAEGPAARTIHDKLDSTEYDLVVMGSHGRRGLRRFMLGSVAEATVRYAPCSVAVIHTPAKHDDE
jgi:nucleotide-binding universal stress UspA family protein